MTDSPAETIDPAPYAIYCPRCGGPMYVAPQHVHLTVACPHCGRPLNAWRITAATKPAAPPVHFPGFPVFAGYSWRNRWLAGLLGIMLGAFGAHRFYLGFTGIGLLQCLLSVGSFFALSPFIAVWGVIEGVLCFAGAMHDAEGMPLSG